MAASPSERIQAVQRERQQLGKAYRAAVRHATLRQLSCPEGPRLTALLKWARKLDDSQGRLLVRTVAAQAWLLNATEDFRHLALSLLHRLIIAKREAAGLVPFDDPLPWGPGPRENVRIKLKNILRVV